MTKIKPEISYDFVPLTREEIIAAHTNGTTVTGFVEKISRSKEVIEVRLGEGLKGILPFSEATMYPLRQSKSRKAKAPVNIRCLAMKKIRVKVIKISGDEIILSRKQNMLEACSKLNVMPKASMHITQVIEKSAFGDIGEGLTGKILINEVCRTHIHHVKQRLAVDQIIDVVVLGPDSENRYAASYRQTFKPYCEEDYPIGMKVTATVGDWLYVLDISKYYVEITPQVSGILVVDQHYHLDYGTKVDCVVTGANEKGLYLKLCKQP